MTDDINYAEEPVSLAAHRADKSDDPADWTARDALVDTLREIDKGNLDLDSIVICMIHKDPNGARGTRWTIAGNSPYESVGLLEYVKTRIITGG